MKQAKVLTDTEFKRLLTFIDGSRHGARNRLAFMLSFYAGFRVGEIASLKVADVFDHEGKPREEIFLQAQYTKTNEARRVYTNGRLRKELERYRLTLDRTPKPDTSLLQSQKGKPFSPNTLCQLFGRLYGQACINGASSHSGRRWFITRLAHSGVSPKVIMELAGHKNLSTTQRYIEVTDDMMRKAVELL